MIHARISLSHFTALDDAMMEVLLSQQVEPDAADKRLRLRMLCIDAMGWEWCASQGGMVNAAAMIVTMALLKQIEIVED